MLALLSIPSIILSFQLIWLSSPSPRPQCSSFITLHRTQFHSLRILTPSLPLPPTTYYSSHQPSVQPVSACPLLHFCHSPLSHPGIPLPPQNPQRRTLPSVSLCYRFTPFSCYPPLIKNPSSLHLSSFKCHPENSSILPWQQKCSVILFVEIV